MGKLALGMDQKLFLYQTLNAYFCKVQHFSVGLGERYSAPLKRAYVSAHEAACCFTFNCVSLTFCAKQVKYRIVEVPAGTKNNATKGVRRKQESSVEGNPYAES